MALDLFKDIINSVLETKKYVFDDFDEAKKSYVPFIVNRAISQHKDAIFYANEMNRYPQLDKDMQYDFYFHALRPFKRRFTKWGKKEEKTDDLKAVKGYYGYSDIKALEAMRLLSEEQITFIREKSDKGGIIG